MFLAYRLTISSHLNWRIMDTTDFTIQWITHFTEYISKKEELFYQANLIWEDILGLEQGIRLLGITLTNLDPLAYENIVLPLWEKS